VQTTGRFTICRSCGVHNIGTWAGAWAYPDQLDGWQPVSITKLVSWFLLMIISVVLVAWVYPPRPPIGVDRRGEPARAKSGDSPESGRNGLKSS